MARPRTGRPPGRPPSSLVPLAYYLLRTRRYSYKEIARLLGVTTGTARKYVSRVRCHLRRPAPSRRFLEVTIRPVVQPGPPEWVWPPERPRAEVRA